MKLGKIMNVKKIITAVAVVAAVGVGAYLLWGRTKTEYVEKVSEDKVKAAYELLSGSLTSPDFTYTDYLNYLEDDFGQGEASALPNGGLESAVLNYRETATYKIEVEKSGLYYLAVDYASAGDSYLDYTVALEVNGKSQYQEQKTVELPLVWKDSVEEYQLDRYGDEIAPTQLRVDGWRNTFLYNNTYSTVHPLYVTLEKGKNLITLTNMSNDGLRLGQLVAMAPADETPTYEEYLAANPAKVVSEGAFLTVNAIDYETKNSAEIIYESKATPSVYPYDVEFKKLNTIKWNKPGDEITYEIEVKEDGLYQLAFHYMNEKEEFDSFETIMIDGQVPFEELKCYPFPYTNGSWANEVLSDREGNPYQIYLTKGTHKLTLKAEMEPVIEAWRYGQLIAEHVTQFALDVKKIAGQDADKYRTWKMTQYIPEIPEYLDAYKTLIQHIRYLLQDDTEYGINGALLTYLGKAEMFIDDMAEYPDEIALYTNSMTGRDNSVLVAISTFNSSIVKLNFSLDRIYIYGEGQLPKERASIWENIWNGVMTVYYSFTSEKYNVNTEDEEVLTVWVNRALTHVDLLQKQVDTSFTPKTGIEVKISVMPDANKMTLAAAADQTPDVALGLASYMPFDLASRGALYDMTQFEDFWQTSNRFVAGAMVPYVYNEGVYAIPETLDFGAVIYRTDIFENLGLQVPGTWDELRELLPELQRYGMNFYHNISSGVGYKWFYQTTPMLFQNGGQLYTADGTATAIDSPASVKGLKELGDLFVAYSLDTQVNEFFNSFRYSVLPIGIVDSNTYILIKNGATELDGQWALAPYLGTAQEDGSIDRWYVANGTGGVIFSDTEKAGDAWTFLKWWTSTETQVEYTYTLRSTYGDTYFWLPSNLEALEQAPIDQEDKDVVMDMVQWIRDVPRTPGQYLVERSISDIWNAMVLDGTSAQVAADEKVIAINREIKKKMQELGYYDQEGNLIKSYTIRDVDWIKQQMGKAGKEGE